MFYLLLFSVFILIAYSLSAFFGVPFVPVHQAQTKKMMEMANVGPGSVVIDLGSGAGRLLFAAAKRGATAVGYELNPFLYFWTKIMIALKGLHGRVSVHCKSLYDADVSAATVVTMFLYPPFMPRLEKKLWSECKPGTTLTSYAFSFPSQKALSKQEGIYLYTVDKTTLVQ